MPLPITASNEVIGTPSLAPPLDARLNVVES